MGAGLGRWMAFGRARGYGAAMIHNRLLLLGAAMAAALALVAPARAANPKKHPDPAKAATPNSRAIGTFDSWTAYVAEDATGRVCYLAGPPQKSEPARFTRNSPMAMVTHRPAENVSNVVSFVEGAPLKQGSDVTLSIGRRKFDLFTNGDSAWARTSELDRSIVTALAGAKDAVVRATPAKGPETTDAYSLAGFPKALAAIDKACGIKRETEPQPPELRRQATPHHHKHAAHPKPKPKTAAAPHQQ